MKVFLENHFDICLVRDIYDGEIPAKFCQAISNHECPATGRELRQPDPSEMLLVAIAK